MATDAGRRALIAAAAFAPLAGCAARPAYRAAEGDGLGYDQTAIEPGRWRVRFLSARGRDEAETLLLRRAAELTLEEGGDHFVVVARDAGPSGRRASRSVFGAPWGGWSSRRGVFGGVTLGADVSRRYAASAEIVIRDGPRPARDPNAYDARAVLGALAGEA